MKVGIVGAGAVGTACLMSVILRGSAREVVLVNRNRKRAQGVATDMQYGAVLSSPIAIHDGDYADLAGSAVIMVTAGVNEKGGGAIDRSDPLGRLRLLDANAAIFQEIIPEIHRAAPDSLILVVSDPPDALADVVRMLGHGHVLSTGTSLDTMRFRFHLARHLGVSASDVEALVLGEHVLRDNQVEVEEIFRHALLRAQRAGELSRKADAKALARFFTVIIQGIRAMARVRSDRKSLEQVARVALGALDQ